MSHSSERIDWMVFKQRLGQGLSRDDPVTWNRAWDQHLETKFNTLARIPEIPDLFPEIDLASGYVTSQPMMSSVHSASEDLCTLEYDLAKFVAQKRAEDGFDAKWLKMSPQEREAYMLEGILISCAAVADMEDRRENCPETTMKNLQRDGGKGFLDLLTTFCPPNVPVERRSEPIFLSHPVHDKIHRVGEPIPGGPNSPRAIMQRYSVVTRNFFLVFFLWNTLLNVYGQSQAYGADRHGHEKEEMRAARQAFRNTPMESVHRETNKEVRDALATADYHCVTCRKSRTANAGKMSCCIDCKKVGRNVWYCGKDCQRIDWRRGTPPHKDICAKNVEFASNVQATPLQQTTTSAADAQDIHQPQTAGTRADGGEFPEPEAGFRRTPALEHQISLLRENPNVDYVLVEPYPRPDHGVQVEHPLGRIMFIMARSRAMKSGDPNSVALMYKTLLTSAKASGVTPARILLQLSKEYAISLDVLSKLVEVQVDDESRAAQRRIDKMAEELDKKLGIRK